MDSRLKTPWQQWLQQLSPLSRTQQECLSRRGNKRDAPAWHVLYVNDVEPAPKFEKFATLPALIEFLRTQTPDTMAVPMFGLPCHFSKPPKGSDRRYLIVPDGKVIPLFDPIEELEIDTSYSLGEADLDLSPVVTASLSRAAAPLRQAPLRSTLMEEDDIDEEEAPEGDYPEL